MKVTIKTTRDDLIQENQALKDKLDQLTLATQLLAKVDRNTIGNLRDQLNLRDKTILVRAARILELEAELAIAQLPDAPQGNLKC